MSAVLKPYSRRKAPSVYDVGFYDQEFQYIQQAIGDQTSSRGGLFYDKGGMVTNIMHPDFGYDGVSDVTPAIMRALAAASIYGTMLVFPPWRYLWQAEVVVERPVIFQGMGPAYGPTFAANSDEKGSYFLLGGNIAGAMLRFTTGSSGTYTQGCGIRDLSFLGNFRAYTVESAVHVEDSHLFELDNVRMGMVNGRALRCTNTVKSKFTRVDADQCGAVGKPAIDLDPSGVLHFVQGSSFSHFSVEVSYGDYLSCSANVQTNKFDDFGFECDPAQAGSLNRMLLMAGQRNQIGKMHFNRLDPAATTAKAEITGDHNTFDSLLFAGQKSSTALAGDLIVSGNDNIFGKIKFWGQVGITEPYKTFVVTGTGNDMGRSVAMYDGGYTLAGDYNDIGSYKSFTGNGQFLVSGLYCDAGLLKIQGSTYAGDLVVLSGARANALVRIINALSATAGVKISSSGKLMPGSYLKSIDSGHAVWFTNNQGEADGVVVDGCGKHGFFTDECEPRSIINCEVRNASGLGASTYDAYSFQSASTRSTGGNFTGNTALMTTTTHRWALFVTDNAGSPRYDYWIFTNFNHKGGGALSVSTGNNIIANNRS